jgi:O-antigen/teichoic acid export membrane protein
MARLNRYVAVGDQAVSSISNFVAVAITANVATAGEFGQFSLAYAGLLLFLGAQRALIGETLLVKYSAAGTLDASVRRGVLGASVLVAGAALPFLLAGAALAEQSSGLIWFVIAASLPFVMLQDTLRYLFICEGRPWRALLIDAVWAILSIGSMAAVASTSGAAAWAVVLCWGCGAAAALALGLMLGRAVPSLRVGVRWLSANRSSGLRYLGEFSALNASNFVVLYLLALPLGAAGVGALRAAQLLFSPLNTAFSAIKMAVIPELVRAKDTAVFRRRLIETFVVVAAMAGLWGTAVMLLPTSMGALVLGATWESASGLRLPYLVQYLAMVPYTVLLAYYRSARADSLSTLMRAVLAVLTLVLPLALGYAGGTAGSAWGFTLGVAIAVLVGGIATGLSLSRPPSPQDPASCRPELGLRGPGSAEVELRPAADAK